MSMVRRWGDLHSLLDPSVRLAHAVVCGLIALQWRTIEQVSKSFTVLPDL